MSTDSPICNLPYIKKIQENVLAVDPHQFDALYKDFLDYPIVAGIGSGRSERAINIACGQLTLMKNSKIYLTPRGPGSPWGRIKESMHFWEETYHGKKILIVLGSGSGKTSYATTAAKDIKEYMEETKSDMFKVDVITSHPSSEVGMVGQKYGNVLELKGGVKKESSGEERFDEGGMMRDLFELGKLFILSIIIKGVYHDSKPVEVRNSLKEELATVGKLVDYSLTNPFYSKAVDVLETRCNVFKNCSGIGDEVTHMTLIRLDHVKEALGERVYFQNPPRPRAGDFQLTVSYSGGSPHIIDTASTFVNLGANQFSVIGGVGSGLEKVSTSSLILPEDTVKGQPRMFYMWTAYALSALPLKLVEKLDKRGIKLPSGILDYYHSITE